MKKVFLFRVLFLLFFCCNTYADDSLIGSDISEFFPEPIGLSEKAIKFEPDPNDTDGDGLKNSDEEKYGTDPNDPDTDNDGFLDLWEITNGTNPNNKDTTGYLEVIDLEKENNNKTSSEDINDANNLSGKINDIENVSPIPDANNDLPPFPWDDVTDLPKIADDKESEIENEYTEVVPPALDNEEDLPLSSDKEIDSISKESLNDLTEEGDNQQAMLNRTSSGMDLTPIYMLLLLNDNDNDGMDDDWELAHFGTLAYGAEGDEDSDNLSNLGEYNNHTDPNNPDTDGEGLTDGFEVLNGLNPTSIDTDEDGLNDAYEITNNLNPKDPDMDDDNLLDGAEIAAGTDPNDSDTDNDSMPDYWEVTSGTNPLVNDRNVDLDLDSYSNLMEYVFHSNPTNPNDVPANASKGSYYEYDELGRIKSIIRAK